MEEHLTCTISFPQRRQPERYDCGAFYNLYKVIGCDNHNGVPATDTISPFERWEMHVAHRLIGAQMQRERREMISIEEMINEVDNFLRKEFKL